MSDVVEAEATSTTEAETTAGKPAVAAKPQEGEAAKAGKQKPGTKEATKTEATPKTDASKDAKGEEQPAESEPEELVFKDKDGNPISDPVIDEFTAIAKEHRWAPDVASQQFDRLRKAHEKLTSNAKENWRAAGEKELRADKEFGGSKFDENRGLAKKAAETLGGAATLKFLVDTGLEWNPHIARLLLKAGQAISQDKFTAGVTVPGRPGDIPNPNDTSVAAFANDYKTAAPQQ